MSRQGWAETLAWQEADGPAVTATAAGSLLIPSATQLAGQSGRFTLPANFFDVGKVLRINAWGRMSNIVTTPGTLTLEVRLGSVVAFTGGAIPLNVVAKTNVTWRTIIMLTCKTIGAGTAATLLGTGDFTSESVVSSVAGTANDCMMPATAPVVGTGFDSTAAQTVDLFATFSLTGNSITLHQYTLESLN